MKVTWNGAPSDPDTIELYGVVFPKGKAVSVSDNHLNAFKFKSNPWFSVAGEKAKADPSAGATVEGKQPEGGSKIDDPVRVPAFKVEKEGGKYFLVGDDGSKSEPMTKEEAELAFDAAVAASGDGD